MNVKRENLSCIPTVSFAVKVSNHLLAAFLWVVVDVKHPVRALGLIFDIIFPWVVVIVKQTFCALGLTFKR